MNIKAELNNEELTIFAEGRIDSTTAEEAEKNIFAEVADKAHKTVVLDIQNLDYISSAGLRVVLRLRKAEPSLKIVNASSDVYEIFEMTGFSEMMPVSKAYRQLSIEGCEVIGQGANGKVYRLDPDTIIKVYFNSDCLPDVHRERELARKAFVLGIPTAIPYDVVKVGDSYGSVFELLNAKSFAKLIIADPANVDSCVKKSVELLKKIHSTEVKPDDMPNMKDVAVNWTKFLKDYLPQDAYEKLLKLVESVPETHNMLHGDYHIKNVMLQNGETLLIDMDTLCYGHPVFEFGSIFLAYGGYAENDHNIVKDFLGISYETALEIWKKTLELYFDTTDSDKLREYENKAKLVGYIRKMRRTIRRNGFDTPEGTKDIETCKQHILELLDTVTTLEF